MPNRKKRKGYEDGGNSFDIVLNSQLDCHDCIFVYSPDSNAGECAVFPIKPSKILDGNKCSEKVTEDEL